MPLQALLTPPQQPLAATDSLVSWVLQRTDEWERHRDTEYKALWEEYYHIWRGKWRPQDRERQVERSKIIAPATQQAIEAQVADLEESIFARKRWFDFDKLSPLGEREDHNTALAETILDNLREDLEYVDVRRAISECLLNGALYGTLIAKICVEQRIDRVPVPFSPGRARDVKLMDKIAVSVVAVDPQEFCIDPAARSINESLGCAHITLVPKHEVELKQQRGIYRKVELGNWTHNSSWPDRSEHEPINAEQVLIHEYHGLVPTRLLPETTSEQTNLFKMAALTSPETEESYSEVILTIANRSEILACVKNLFIMQDRGFIAAQYDTVPNRFWGRGLCEKAYNPQKALDTEIRARIDSLALSTYPMTVMNTLMAPRGMNMEVRPGKSIRVNGSASEALNVLKLPGPDGNSYRHAADLERMVTVATGAIDTAAPLGVNPRNETASGMSMMLGATLKRAKRTLRNIEDQFLQPLITKIMWRQMQFATERYPVQDYKFIVHGTMGAAAREFEVAQLTQLLQTMHPDSAAYWIVLRGILKNFSVDEKDELLDLVEKQIEMAIHPQPPQPSFADQLKARELELKQAELSFRIDQAADDKSLKERQIEAEAKRDEGEARWSTATAIANIRKAKCEELAARSQYTLHMTQAVLNVAKAAAERADAKAEQALVAQDSEQRSSELLELARKMDESHDRIMAISDAMDRLTNLPHRFEPKDLTPEIEELRTAIDTLAEQQHLAHQNIGQNTSEPNQQLPDVVPMIAQLQAQLEALEMRQRNTPSESPDLSIERSPDGQILSIGGRRVKRDDMGRLAGI